jgi:hypothetical protein
MTHAQPFTTVLATIDHISTSADDISIASLVTDTGEQLALPTALLPDGAAAGDVLRIHIMRDADATRERAARVSELQRKLFE